MDFIWSQHLNVKLYACRCRWFYMSINRVDGVLVCVFESGRLWSKQHILQSSFKSHIQHSRYNTEPRYFCVWNGVVWCVRVCLGVLSYSWCRFWRFKTFQRKSKSPLWYIYIFHIPVVLSSRHWTVQFPSIQCYPMLFVYVYLSNYTYIYIRIEINVVSPVPPYQNTQGQLYLTRSSDAIECCWREEGSSHRAYPEPFENNERKMPKLYNFQPAEEQSVIAFSHPVYFTALSLSFPSSLPLPLGFIHFWCMCVWNLRAFALV